MADARPTRARKILAWIVVVLTVIAVWKFVDYRNQPPAVSSVAAPL
jgi:t-SNARE complex subunit (syntaxin)